MQSALFNGVRRARPGERRTSLASESGEGKLSRSPAIAHIFRPACDGGLPLWNDVVQDQFAALSKESLLSDHERIRLFSYGTLRQPEVQIASFGRLLDGTDDAMTGCHVEFLEITDPAVLETSGERFHPVVMPSADPADEVPGRVFEISEAELRAADAYEVSDYIRTRVRLRSGIEAWVYAKADILRDRT